MKKFFSMLMVCAMVLSIGMSAFADNYGSPELKEISDETTSPMAHILWYESEKGNEDWGLYVCEKETGEHIRYVKRSDMNVLTLTNAEKELSEEEFEVMSREYDRAQEISDKLLKYFFWLGFKNEEEKLADNEYLELRYVCFGTGVETTVNGNDMKTEKADMDKPDRIKDSYVAELTELGAVGIWVDPEQ